jgi:hypothetical protein
MIDELGIVVLASLSTRNFARSLALLHEPVLEPVPD